MLNIKTMLIGAIVASSLAAGTAVAADKDHGWSHWKAGEAEQSKAPGKFGDKCKAEFTSRGTGEVGFGITQYWAKRHTRRAWEEAAVKLYGADFGKWSKAKGTSVSCEKKDKLWECKATGSPCT